MALTYHLENLFRPAIEEFQKAIQLDEQLWGSYLFLGMDYYKTNQFDKAVPALEKSLVLNREGAESEARFWLGLSFSALGKHGEATEQLQRLTQVRADDIEVLFHLARAQDRHASTLFATIGRIDPRSSLVHLLQAERSAAEDRPALARFEYQQALQLRPDVRGLIPALGKFTGQTLPSPSDRPESPLRMSLYDMRANYKLGEFYLTHGAEVQGLDHLKRVASQTPTDADSEQLVQASQQRLEKWKPDSVTADGRTAETTVGSPILSALEALKSGQYEDGRPRVQEVDISVQVKVHELRAPAQQCPRVFAEAGHIGYIGKLAVPVVAIEGVVVVREISDDEIKVAVIVVVAKVHPHAGLLPAVVSQSHAVQEPNLDRFDEAESLFARAVVRDAASPHAYVNLAFVLLEQGRTASAEAWLAKMRVAARCGESEGLLRCATQFVR